MLEVRLKGVFIAAPGSIAVDGRIGEECKMKG